MLANPINVSEIKVFGSFWIFLAFKNSAGRTCRSCEMAMAPRIWHAFHIYCFHCCHSYLSWLCMPACFKGMCWDDFEERPGAQVGIDRHRVVHSKQSSYGSDGKGFYGSRNFRIIHINTLIYTLQKRKIMHLYFAA